MEIEEAAPSLPRQSSNDEVHHLLERAIVIGHQVDQEMAAKDQEMDRMRDEIQRLKVRLSKYEPTIDL